MKRVNNFIIIATAMLMIFSGCKDVETEAATLEVFPTDAVAFAADGTTTDEVTFTVTTNQSYWDAESDEDWLTVTTDDTEFTLSAEANTTTNSREATITVTAGAAEAITITATQAAYASGTSELQSIAVTKQPTKTTYEVGDVIDLTGLVVTGTYSDGKTKTLSVTKNNVTYDFSSAGQKTVTVTLGGKTTTFVVDVEAVALVKSTSFISASTTGGPYEYNIITDGAWTAISSATWCTISPASGNGNTKLTITVPAANEFRAALITVTYGEEKDLVTVAQALVIDRNLQWTDANGTHYNTIPTEKTHWNNGEVLEYKKATKGAGANLVIIGDAFNPLELAVGSVYEIVSKDLADEFLRMPVVRDYQEYFNVYILMWNFKKSGLFNEYPNGGFHNIIERAGVFNPRINAIPQLAAEDKNQNTTVIYNANGWSGGFMTTVQYNYASYQFSVAELSPVYWMIHECMGHAFAALADEYLAPGNIAEWDTLKWTPPLITPETKPIEWNWAQNSFVSPWSAEAWEAMIARPGNAGYAANLDDYRQIDNTHWTAPRYIWKNQTGSNFMRTNPSMSSDPWVRFLVYKRIMELAKVPYSVVDFLENDNKKGYTKVTDWYDYLGLAGWKHSVPAHNHDKPSPYELWNTK